MRRNHMDATDKRILDIIQTGFPIAPRPYAVVGEQVGLTEAETLSRVRALKGKGIIRRIGANFQSAKIGFKSTLCAASVSAEKLDAFIAVVNAHPGVTHNYLRDHPINIWFTMIGESREAIREALVAITEVTKPGKPGPALNDALSGFNNQLIWLIVIAVMVALAISKTGLGTRIGYYFIKLIGKKTLGVAYGLVVSELVIAPVTPSNTARGGGMTSGLFM